MTNPTTPFGWQMPTSTDLVTDLPADFETFGQAVATSMADLLGGTTGQILAKASNTNMDFTWVTNDVGDITAVTAGTGLSGGGTSGAVTLSIDTAVTADLTTAQTLTNKTLTSPALTTPTISTLTTNGDTIYGTGSGAISRLGIGTTGQVLTVAGGIPSWATPSGGGSTYSGASVFNSSNQSHSTGADLTPSFDSEKFDVGGYHDNSTNNSRLTVPTGKTGYFLVSAFLGWSSNSSSVRVIQFIKNSAAQVSRLSVAAANGDTTYANLTDVLYLTAGDYITLQLYQASGSTLTIQSGTANIGFSMTYLGA
jgi:hypothetical protein